MTPHPAALVSVPEMNNLSAGESAFTAWAATSGADGTRLMWTWAEMPPSQRERWEKIALAAAPAAPQAAGVGGDDAQWVLENYGAGHPRIQRIVSTVRAPSSEPVSESRALDWMEWVAQGALDIDDVQLSGTEIIQNAVIELASIRKCAALSTREEAPAPTCQRCGGEIAGWCCQKCPAEFRENDDGVLVFDDDEEAPAEAGEASPLDRLKALSVGNGLGPLGMEQFRSALSAFRARSSVPEARALAPSAPDQAKEGE